jgi:ssDNA-binding Zn-finger/Zn-ribbon topoisomerase 1
MLRLIESRHGPFYGCTRYPLCKGAHKAHPNGAPLGIPANAETKAWRVKAHLVFDQIWKEEFLTRDNAYCWMQRALELSEGEAHIGRFDIATCKLLIERVHEDFPDLDVGDSRI